MTMRRSADALPRPEDADSWGEFNARLERETDSLKSPLTVWWWTAAVALFGAGVMFGSYALTGRDWWLFPCALAPLPGRGIDGGARDRPGDAGPGEGCRTRPAAHRLA